MKITLFGTSAKIIQNTNTGIQLTNSLTFFDASSYYCGMKNKLTLKAWLK